MIFPGRGSEKFVSNTGRSKILAVRVNGKVQRVATEMSLMPFGNAVALFKGYNPIRAGLKHRD